MKKFCLFALIAMMTMALVAPAYAEMGAEDKLNRTITGKRDFRGDFSWKDSKRTVEAPVPYTIPLAAVCVSGAPIGADGTTAPGLATTDGIPAIVWADDEVTPIEYTFRIPAGMEGERLGFRGFASTDDATTPPEIDWALYVNFDGTAFDAAAYAGDAVTLSGISATLNETFELEPTSTIAAGVTAGGWATITLWPTTTGGGTVELKGLEYYFDKD
jgi:hypothetical protein